jgi:hypothetical protein
MDSSSLTPAEVEDSEEDDVEEEEEEEEEDEDIADDEEDDGMEEVWEVNIGSRAVEDWMRFDPETEAKLVAARRKGKQEVQYAARGQTYALNISRLYQENVRTRVKRSIRWSKREIQVEKDPTIVVAPRSERLNSLVDHLLSPAVQVPLPTEIPDEPQRLTEEEVRRLFVKHVPGVEKFLFRDLPGQYSLSFAIESYASGLRDYNKTPLGKHLLNLLRVVVHHCYDAPDSSSASRHLYDVAAAFRDCQAIQARTIETVGLQVLGITADFRGLVERLIGDYKKLVLTMRAMEKVALGEAVSDRNPTHFENRLIADLGDMLGLDKDLIQLAQLDFHANQRHAHLSTAERKREVVRCRQLFDFDAVLQALVAEVNRFAGDSDPQSLPALFVKWADANMNRKHKHVIFDSETCSKMEVTQPLALAVLETLFFGSPRASPEEMHGDVLMTEVFSRCDCESANAPEEYARLEAAENAQLNAEEEARLKAEEDAKKKEEAAEEARQKAEEVARLKAEEDRQKKEDDTFA